MKGVYNNNKYLEFHFGNQSAIRKDVLRCVKEIVSSQKYISNHHFTDEHYFLL